MGGSCKHPDSAGICYYLIACALGKEEILIERFCWFLLRRLYRYLIFVRVNSNMCISWHNHITISPYCTVLLVYPVVYYSVSLSCIVLLVYPALCYRSELLRLVRLEHDNK